MNAIKKYNTNLTGGSLQLPESRKIAQILLNGYDKKSWHQLIYIENVLRKRSPSHSKKRAGVIRKRLELMGPELWKMVIDGDTTLAIQALLASTIKENRLFGDFLYQVVKEHFRIFNAEITCKDWFDFFEQCQSQEPELVTWSEISKKKIAQVTFRILTEARYIESTKMTKLTPITLESELRRYLKENREDYVLQCMEIGK